jgi:hypothetical protein
MHKDYELGYADGYEAGWKAAKNSFSKPISFSANIDSVASPTTPICPVCGISRNGDPLGIKCEHPMCPIKIEWK